MTPNQKRMLAELSYHTDKMDAYEQKTLEYVMDLTDKDLSWFVLLPYQASLIFYLANKFDIDIYPWD